MKIAGLALTMGIGAALGAVGVMMLPHQSSARRLANKAANKVEDAAWMVSDKIMKTMDM